MGFLNLFSKPVPSLLRLTSGSFTLDRSGRVVVTTLPSTFPTELVSEIGRHVLSTFHEAQAAQIPLAELIVCYPALRITARELRGGAIVYLALQTLTGPVKQP
ncbi:MAG: hypothetical protein IH623_28540 [Verrucomicrobia bacterium]|nr:hypothetical protein [Verrucomicrobiota bacterium]